MRIRHSAGVTPVFIFSKRSPSPNVLQTANVLRSENGHTDAPIPWAGPVSPASTRLSPGKARTWTRRPQAKPGLSTGFRPGMTRPLRPGRPRPIPGFRGQRGAEAARSCPLKPGGSRGGRPREAPCLRRVGKVAKGSEQTPGCSEARTFRFPGVLKLWRPRMGLQETLAPKNRDIPNLGRQSPLAPKSHDIPDLWCQIPLAPKNRDIPDPGRQSHLARPARSPRFGEVRML
jgi:hypothetical protein